MIVSPTVSSITVAAGEAIALSFQPASSAGVPEDLTGRAFVFAIYNGEGEQVYSDARVVTDGEDPHACWLLDGTVTRALASKSGLIFNLIEREHIAIAPPIAVGTVTITPTAPRFDDLASAPVAKYTTRITRLCDDATIYTPAFRITTAAYVPDSGPVIDTSFSLDFSQPSNSMFAGIL